MEDSDEIRRISHIHRVGDGAERGLRVIASGQQELWNDVVDVGGGNKAVRLQTESLRHQPGGEIPEVSAGHAEHEITVTGGQLSPRAEVIKDLRQQTPDIDGVCGSEPDLSSKLVILKRLFGKPLTVVEGSRDGKRGYVVAEGGELALLDIAHLPIREEHHDPGSLETEKCLCHRAAGVA